jgi:histidine kinase
MARLHEELDVSRMDEMKKGIAFATADPDISQGRFGRRLSGYAPIHDRRSRPIGVLGLDMRASDIEKLKTEMLDVTLLYLLIGAIASLVLGRIGASTIIGPITALSAGVRDIQAKKYGTLINMQRDDEIGELIRVFNQMSAKLFEVDRIKSSFLSVISHELYTPLTPIRGGAEQLKTITGLTEDFKQIVNMIDHHSKKLQDLIDELLDFSWLEVKEWKLNKEPVSIQHVVEEACAEMKVKLQEKGMVLEINIPLDTPTILADKKRVIHVVKIMLDNAIKFSPEKSPLYLTIARGPDKVMVELLDFGIGMSPENLEKIFDAFYQIEDHLTRSHGGVGLGLAIAKRIIEAHSGLIWAESPGPGRGSRFTFSLPIR